MLSKIYTKTGDKGETSLIGGTRVAKYHIRLESYGTIDELNSYLGLIHDVLDNEYYKSVILKIQNTLFTVCSELANEKALPLSTSLTDEDILFLEKQIDDCNAELPPLASFILPGGHTTASYCHIARTVCRRAERCIVKLSAEAPVSEKIIKYVNRLSDFLFILARKLLKDFNKPEIIWKTDL